MAYRGSHVQRAVFYYPQYRISTTYSQALPEQHTPQKRRDWLFVLPLAL